MASVESGETPAQYPAVVPVRNENENENEKRCFIPCFGFVREIIFVLARPLPSSRRIIRD